MKIQEGYFLREVLDMFVIMGKGKAAYAPNCIMSINETGAFLWNLMKDGAEKAELVAKMTEEYDVTPDVAQRDVDVFIEQLREKALIVE